MLTGTPARLAHTDTKLEAGAIITYRQTMCEDAIRKIVIGTWKMRI